MRKPQVWTKFLPCDPGDEFSIKVSVPRHVPKKKQEKILDLIDTLNDGIFKILIG